MKLNPLALAGALIFAATTLIVAAPPAGWTEDYAKALEKAKAEKKNLLLDFTGSDWCGYCKALDQEVFSTPQFKSWAKDNVVLVKVDFPKHTPQNAKVKQQNSELKSKFPFSGYPTVLVVDPEGKQLSRAGGYKVGSGPAAYLERLKGSSKE